MSTPTTLDEAFAALDEELSDDDRERFRRWEESFEALAAEIHHSLGRFLRNKWGLWGNSALAQHMREVHHVSHPDDMTHEIIVRYCQRLLPTRFERI